MKKKMDLFEVITAFLLIILAFLMLYPFVNTLAVSLNEAGDTARGGIYFLPRQITLENYIVISNNERLYRAFVITVARTALGTLLSVICTAMFAYGMSKAKLKGRNFYMGLSILTLYFSGGLIPTYLLMKWLHLTNSFMVYVIPYMIGVYNMIIMRTYFKTIPDSMEESAKIDGAGQMTIFFKIMLPLSAPIIATIGLFAAVFHWNQWFDASLYVTDINLKPLQTILTGIINSQQYQEVLAQAGAGATQLDSMKIVNVRSISTATIIVSVLPIVIIYPFIQKYFVKGIMIGSVKE